MVYRGKPSKGCQGCRRRRIRCDLREPSCSSCERLGWQCSGYRNQIDLMFHNETEAVTKRQQQPLRRAQRSKATGDGPTFASQLRMLCGPGEPTRTLGPSMDDFALSYCYSHHILHPDPETGTNLYVQDQTYLTCMKAVGLASYSNISRSVEMAAKARTYYVDAIQSTNAALSSPACIGDYTLLAVMAMAFFESISGGDARSLEAWKRHIEGMAALLILRGSEQLETSDGRHLFLTAVGSLGAKCLTLGIRLPHEIQDLMDEAVRQYGGEEDPLWRTSSTMMQLANLYSDFRSGEVTDSQVIVDRATQLDDELSAGLANAPQTWQYKICPPVFTRDSEIDAVFPHHCYVFPNAMVAQTWSVMCIGRIICNAMIRFAALQQHGQDACKLNCSRIKDASSVIYQMQMDILAGVPQYLGMVGVQPSVNTSHHPEDCFALRLPEAPVAVWKAANIEMKRLPSLRIARGHQLLWGVGLVGRVEGAGHPIRIAACKILRLAGVALGLSQAFAYAAALEKDRMVSGRPCSFDHLQ